MIGCAAISYAIDVHRFDLDIRSTNVSEELKDLYEATGAHIIYYDEWHMPARGLKGSYTVEDAVIRILGNTGLMCEYMEDGSIIIRPFMGERTLGRCLRPQRHPPSDSQGPTPVPQEEMAEVDIFGQLGTHILGLEQVGSPLVSWDRVQIRSSGAQNLSDLLSKMTQNFGGGPTQQTHFGQGETFTNSFLGTSSNLRGLGSRATLVLWNGQPVAPSGSAAAVVDLDQIPLSAIDQVEVLLDGASAFYGSDAVAGVINIHTKRDYIRPETFAEIGTVTKGHQERHRVSQELGSRWDGGDVLIVGEVMHRGALSANGRWQNSSNVIPGGTDSSPFYYSNPGNLLASNNTYAIPNEPVDSTLDFASLKPGPFNRMDNYNGADVLPNQSRWSVLGSLRQALGGHATLFGDVLWAQRRALERLGGDEVALDVTSSPFLLHPPSGPVIELYNLLQDLGPEITTVDVRTSNAIIGLQLNLARKWHMVLSGSHSLESENQISYDVADPTALQLAVFNPNAPIPSSNSGVTFDPFGSGHNLNPATATAAQIQPWYGSRSELWNFALAADGPVFRLPAGPVHQAIGFEYRDQRFSSGISETVTSSDLRRQRYSGYLEFAAPILNDKRFASPWRSLMLSVAGRMEDYSDFGKSFAPRVGVTWGPIEHLQISSTWSRSVRAPNMEDLVTRSNTSFVRFLGDTPALIWSGGNADLKVEKASTRTVGLSFKSDDEDLPRFTAAVSYFDILFRARIQQSDFPADILTNPAYRSVVNLVPDLSDRQRACTQSQYLSTDGSGCIDAQVGAIVDLRTHNAGRLWTDGIDAQVGSNFPGPLGKLGFSVLSTYVFDYKEAAGPDAPLESLLDTLSNPLAWRLIATGTWSVGAAQASLTLRHTKGYRNTQVRPLQRVAAWNTADLRLSYIFNADDLPGTHPVELALNCQNLANRYSPFAFNTVANLGYDQENGSLQGRVVTLSAYLQF